MKTGLRIRLAAIVVVPAICLASLAVYAGGYVPPKGTLLVQATSISLAGTSNVTPTFNNATLTNQNNIAEVNNNPIKTPSTTDPVSTVTGNNYHDETDFTIKGRAGLNYAFTRTFNSASSSTAIDKGLGFGWVHSYAMRLKSNDYGACPNCTQAQATVNGNGKTSSITYTDERGGDHNYLVNEATYGVTPPAGEFDNLAFDTPSAGQHTLTFRNGTKYVFQTIGAGVLKTTPNTIARLIQIADPWGNQLNLTYDATGRLSTITDNLGIAGRTGLTFAYDGNNHLQTISDWSGRKWTYVVDSNGNLASYKSPQPLITGTTTIAYAYAPNSHNLTKVSKPLRNVATNFTYYENGRTFNDSDALGNAETLDYDLFRSSTRVTDPLGGIRSYEYDSSGRMIKLTEPDGAILMFKNQPDGLRYAKRDGLGYLTQYSYKSDKTFNTASDTFGNVTREQDPLLQTVDTTYGPYDQVASVKDKRGTTSTTSFYSGSGTCIAAGKPNTVTLSTLSGSSNVKLRSYCWNSDATLASQTDYLSPTDTTKTRVTTYTYDTAAHLNVQSVTITGWDGTSVTKNFTYDNLGRKATETLARRVSPTNSATVNLTTITTYDALDRIQQVQDAVGDLFINRYDDNGKNWQITHQYKKSDGTFDVRNIVTRTYDSADRVQYETDALGGITVYSYDHAGNVISVSDPESHQLAYQYDSMNRRISVTDADDRTIRTSYDLAGHALSVTNGNGETITTSYDALGRPLTVQDAHGYLTTFSFDANNNRKCVIDANAQANLQPKNSDGCTVSTQFDELNRSTLQRDALNGTTQTTYDLLGNPVTQIDAEGRLYAWGYDGLGRMISETDPTGATTNYALDQAGNIYQKTNRLAETTQIAFDNLNRPINVSYLKDGTSEAFGYDQAGNLNSAANNNIGYSMKYDNLNRLLNKIDSRSGLSLSFTWDKASHMQTKTTYQNSTTHYTYDGAGTLVSIFNPDYLTVNYQYDNAGRVLSRVMSSGAKSIYTYDSGGWLQTINQFDATGTTVANQSYTRDHVGNITGTSVIAGATPGSISYTLDALYRLTAVNAPNTANSEGFTYDHIGNRMTRTVGGTTIGATGTVTRYYNYLLASQTGAVVGYTPTYHHRLNTITIGSISGSTESGFGFDMEGRLTSQTGLTPRTLTWDAKGRMKTVLQNSSTETYRYDPNNYRIGRLGGMLGTLDYYLEGEHLESVVQTGSVVEKYFRGSSTDELVAGFEMQNGEFVPTMYQHDQVNSVVAESNVTGGTQASFTYTSFGQTQAISGTQASRLKFTGREDDGNGLYYYRARYYDPVIGRFISEDPKKFAAGINFYAYTNNNPVNGNDPYGFQVTVTGGNNTYNIAFNNVYFTGCGSTCAVFATKYVNATQTLLSGQFPPYQVNTTVTLAPGNAPVFGGIQINVSPGTTLGTVNGLTKTGEAGLADPNTSDASVYANIPAGANKTTIAHEDFHLLAPNVDYAGHDLPGNDIMSLYDPNVSRKVTGSDFTQAFGSLPSTSGVHNELSDGGDTNTTSDQGAAGGFLIYPNKPNSNQSLSVYSK
ncbi:RHS repeat-associated protein [Oxalobacteraceae bacterium GrIS 2.11]